MAFYGICIGLCVALWSECSSELFFWNVFEKMLVSFILIGICVWFWKTNFINDENKYYKCNFSLFWSLDSRYLVQMDRKAKWHQTQLTKNQVKSSTCTLDEWNEGHYSKAIQQIGQWDFQKLAETLDKNENIYCTAEVVEAWFQELLFKEERIQECV